MSSSPIHVTADGFDVEPSGLDDPTLIHDLLLQAMSRFGAPETAGPVVTPYDGGNTPEDRGVTGFGLFDGGHVTLHTFSHHRTFFADLLTRAPVDPDTFQELLADALPCDDLRIQQVRRSEPASPEDEPDIHRDFGPHLLLDIDDYQGPATVEEVSALLEPLPARIGMTAIAPPHVVAHGAAAPSISGIIPIAESHISLHINPASRTAYFDVFSCKFFDFEATAREFKALLPGRVRSETLVRRGPLFRCVPAR